VRGAEEAGVRAQNSVTPKRRTARSEMGEQVNQLERAKGDAEVEGKQKEKIAQGKGAVAQGGPRVHRGLRAVAQEVGKGVVHNVGGSRVNKERLSCFVRPQKARGVGAKQSRLWGVQHSVTSDGGEDQSEGMDDHGKKNHIDIV